MNRVKFHVYTFVGSLPWCVGLAYVGQRLGQELLKETSPLKHFMHRFDLVIGLAIVAAAVWFVRSRLKALKAYRAEAREAAAAGAGEGRLTATSRHARADAIARAIASPCFTQSGMPTPS
jgi:hypothetical protein